MIPRRRVLVAGSRQFIALAGSVLGVEVEAIGAQSVAEGLRCVDRGVDLILCSLRFDDSRMFDFLGALASRPAARGVPVVCCKLPSPRMSAGARRAIALALEALGVDEFVDMQAIAERAGLEAAREALRRAAHAHLEKRA